MFTLTTYRNWSITFNPKPIPDRRHDYDVVHEEYTGDEDDRAFTVGSLAEAILEIENREED